MRKLFLISVLPVVALVVGLVAIDQHRNDVVAHQASTTQNPVR